MQFYGTLSVLPILVFAVCVEHDKLQEQLKLLQHRQDLFQQQGLADLIVDTIEMVGRHLNMLCVRSLAGRRLGFSLVLTNQMLLNLLGKI